MKLQPLRQPLRPSYPAHRRRRTGLAAWARRVAAVAATSGALALGGCYGASPFGVDDEEPEHTVEEVDPVAPLVHAPPIPPVSSYPEPIPGGERAPSFQCDAPPEWTDFLAPTYLDGHLCGEGTAWAELEVAEGATFRVALTSGVEYVSLSVIAADDAELAVLDADTPEVTLDLPAASYLFAATAIDPVGNPNAWFAVTIELY